MPDFAQQMVLILQKFKIVWIEFFKERFNENLWNLKKKFRSKRIVKCHPVHKSK